MWTINLSEFQVNFIIGAELVFSFVLFWFLLVVYKDYSDTKENYFKNLKK